MPRILQQRRGTTSGLASTLGAAGELFVDTSLVTVVVHDGVTTGGVTLARQADLNILSSSVSSSINTLSSSLTSSINAMVLVPIGGIIMWSGATTSVPDHWNLCDGTNDTPDLRNKFIVGAGSTYAPGNTGGTSNAIVVSHSHTITDPGHKHQQTNNGPDVDTGSLGTGAQTSGTGYGSQGTVDSTASTKTTSTGITIDTAGQSGVNQNLPPYYALAYIMRIS